MLTHTKDSFSGEPPHTTCEAQRWNFMIQGHHHCTCSEDVISSKLVKQEFNDGPDQTIKPHR